MSVREPRRRSREILAHTCETRRGGALWLTAALLLAAFPALPQQRINLDDLGRLPAFSHATRVGDLVFVSGTLGTKAGSIDLVEGGVGPETTQTLRNIERILMAAGSSLRALARCTVYLTDMSTFEEMNRAWIAALGHSPPARATIGVRELALGARVEIECIAEREDQGGTSSHPTQSTGFLSSEGEQIYYEVTGDGEALVLAHGYGGNHAIWFQQVPVLAQFFRVVTWDQRGFGRSSNLQGSPGPASSARDLAALLDHLGIERAHFVGQSMGGWTVTAFAVDNPKRVLSLLLADTLGGVMDEEIRTAFARWLQNARRDTTDQPITSHPALGEALARRDPARAFLYRQIGSLAPPAPAEIPLQLLNSSYLGRLPAITSPIAFLVGGEDPIFPPELIEQAASLVPRSRVVVIENAGHSPYFERPEAWNRAVLGLLLPEGAR